MKIKTTTLLEQFLNLIDNRKIVIYQVDIQPDNNIYFYYKKNVAARFSNIADYLQRQYHIYRYCKFCYAV